LKSKYEKQFQTVCVMYKKKIISIAECQ